jgi:hypothetical protein
VPLAIAGIVAWQFGPHVFRACQIGYFQWVCGRYAIPRDTVVSEEPGRWGGVTPPFLLAARDPQPLLRLTSLDYYYQYPAHANMGPWFLQPTGPDAALLFMHWRTTPGGRERLVILRRVSPQLRQSWDAPLAFLAVAAPRVSGLGSADLNREDLRWLPEVVPQVFTDDATKVAVRFYAGQPDPADASRFTMAFEADGQPGTVEGRLVDAPNEPGGVRVELNAR